MSHWRRKLSDFFHRLGNCSLNEMGWEELYRRGLKEDNGWEENKQWKR